MRPAIAAVLGSLCLILLSCSSKDTVVELTLKNRLVSLDASVIGGVGGMDGVRGGGQYGGDIGGRYGSNGEMGGANAGEGTWTSARGYSQTFLQSFRSKYKSMLAKFPSVEAATGSGSELETGTGAGSASRKSGYGWTSSRRSRVTSSTSQGSDSLDCNLGEALREIITTGAMPGRICVLSWTKGMPFGEKYLTDW